MASSRYMPANETERKHRIMFAKCLYFNRYLYKAWIITMGLTLAEKISDTGLLSELTIYLSGAVYTLVVILEAVRIVIGQIATTRNGVPEMGGFLLLTNFMQIPLVSYFFFNPYLKSMPVERILNGSLLFLAITEALYGFVELKYSSAVASRVYLAEFRDELPRVIDDRIETEQE